MGILSNRCTAPLADPPEPELCDPLPGRPVGPHHAIGRTADVIFVDTRNGSEHPGDVVLWKFSTHGICGDNVLNESRGLLCCSTSNVGGLSWTREFVSCTYQYACVDLELFCVLALV